MDPYKVYPYSSCRAQRIAFPTVLTLLLLVPLVTLTSNGSDTAAQEQKVVRHQVDEAVSDWSLHLLPRTTG